MLGCAATDGHIHLSELSTLSLIMREVVTMWRDTRMIMLTAVVAAVYAAVLIGSAKDLYRPRQ